ncbi:MAG: ABC transporter substrate-binding protein [Clostridiales bacterium]|nr:ABC transporter substrate-binding protein [Clostridiales bacterium]
MRKVTVFLGTVCLALLCACGAQSASTTETKAAVAEQESVEVKEADTKEKQGAATEGEPGSDAEGAQEESSAGLREEIVVSLGDTSCSGNFDPTQKWNRAYDFFHSCLMTFDNDLNMIPDLATAYEVSEDHLVYTFKLREDVKFSDGRAMTADDVVFTYEKAKESGLSINLTYMESAEAVDDYTVRFTLSQPYSPFLANTTFLGIVSKDDWDESYGLHPVGTGKYKLVQLDQEQQMILEANEYYYGEQPSIKKITVLALPDDVVYAAIQAGTVDLANIPANQAGLEIPGYHILTCETNVTKFLHLPCLPETVLEDGKTVGNAVTSDPVIRQALNIGINRQEIAEDVLNGYGEPAHFLLENMAWSEEAPQFEDNRPEEACRMLEEAGWIDSDGDGIREKDGVKAQFTVNGSANETERYNIAVAVAQQARPLGIQMDVVSLPWSDCRAEAGTTPTVWSVGNYQSIDVSNYAQSDLAGISYYNPSYYKNETVDSYIEQAINATPEEALGYWKKAQYDGTEGMNTDLPYLPVILAQDVYYVKDGLDVGEQRVHDHGMGGISITYNLEKWSYHE